MSDQRLRQLERAAELGDPAARERLARERRRTGTLEERRLWLLGRSRRVRGKAHVLRVSLEALCVGPGRDWPEGLCGVPCPSLAGRGPWSWSAALALPPDPTLCRTCHRNLTLLDWDGAGPALWQRQVALGATVGLFYSAAARGQEGHEQDALAAALEDIRFEGHHALWLPRPRVPHPAIRGRLDHLRRGGA